jgi:thymidylate kinase
VDCVLDPGVSPRRLLALLHQNSERIGAKVVRCLRYHIVLAGENPDGSPCFVTLDFGTDCDLDDLSFYDGSEVLTSRRRYRQFWVPAGNVEFGCYLARTIAKGALDDERARRLAGLFDQDPAGCAREVERFWSGGSADMIVLAARSGHWGPVRLYLNRLQAELRTRAIQRRPWRFMRNRLRGVLNRMNRIWRPNGVNVVLLGPDGAGKSSTIDAVAEKLAPAFSRWTCLGFAPPILHYLLRRRPRSTNQPHALPARSLPVSVLRAGYWFAYNTFGYASLHLALARTTLVMHDRHLIDILVDAKRYRYGGPLWLLRVIWRLAPKPDLIILLDAAPEVLQARKQEVPFDETARQRSAYLSLVQTMQNGRVVDASQSFDHVTNTVSQTILRHLATRVARRFGLEQEGGHELRRG